MEIRASNEPVKHLVIDEWLGDGCSVNAVHECLAAINPDSDKWVTYNNADERKATCNIVTSFGERLRYTFGFLQSQRFVNQLIEWFNITPLQSDPLLHGGGIHRSGPGGALSIHLDYARHPLLPHLERRINVIVYLVPRWEEEWGGATVFTKPDGATVLNRVYPKPGRLLAFITDDLSYHGVEPVTCPEGIERVTLATYYLSPIREGVTRERALFIPNRKAS